MNQQQQDNVKLFLFFSKNCPHCQQLLSINIPWTKIFTLVPVDNKKVRNMITKTNIKIQSVPTLAISQNGYVVKYEGSNKIMQWIDEVIIKKSNPPPPTQQQTPLNTATPPQEEHKGLSSNNAPRLNRGVGHSEMKESSLLSIDFNEPPPQQKPNNSGMMFIDDDNNNEQNSHGSGGKSVIQLAQQMQRDHEGDQK
jgi:hypothetical protein